MMPKWGNFFFVEVDEVFSSRRKNFFPGREKYFLRQRNEKEPLFDLLKIGFGRKQFGDVGTIHYLCAVKKKFLIILLCVVAGFLSPFRLVASGQDSIQNSIRDSHRRSIGQRMLTPVRWLINNWSDYDPAYSTPSFYNWASQVQNTFSKEMIAMDCEGMSNLYLTSRSASRIGPYFGYNFLFWGLTIDLNNLQGARRRHEFTIAVNSQLMNIDLIYRRTGGDFYFRELSYRPMFSPEEQEGRDIADWANQNDLGRTTCYDITGVNASYFLNHRRYSNPAAFSNGAIQLRSCGSPIVGFGYTHHRLKMEVSDMLVRFSSDMMGLPAADRNYLSSLYDTDRRTFFSQVRDRVMQNPDILFADDGELMASLFNRVPSRVSVEDWHLQLGYGYNYVFSRRSLFGISGLVAPSVKHITSTNEGTFPYLYADELSRLLNVQNDLEQFVPGMFRTTKHGTSFSADAFLRLSYVWNYNHWRAGLYANLNSYGFVFNRSMLLNTYGSAAVYLGYTFGRMRKYRYGGKLRDAYIDVALSDSQIEEIRDSLPLGNLPYEPEIQSSAAASTDQEPDLFLFELEGFNLAEGPEGTCGSFELQDGYIPEGVALDRQVAVGKSFPINQSGQLALQLGHKSSFRASNWWKSQVDLKGMKLKNVPEKLHYALRGTLTCYVKSEDSGRDGVEKLVVEDVFLCHGTQLMSPYELSGTATIGGQPCEMILKIRERGKVLKFKFKR